MRLVVVLDAGVHGRGVELGEHVFWYYPGVVADRGSDALSYHICAAVIVHDFDLELVVLVGKMLGVPRNCMVQTGCLD